MKNILAVILLLFPILVAASCEQAGSGPKKNANDSTVLNTDVMIDTIIIKVGNSEFTATLLDNPTAAAFKAMLPLNINMTELTEMRSIFVFLRTCLLMNQILELSNLGT